MVACGETIVGWRVRFSDEARSAEKRDEMKLIPCDSFNVDWSILVTRLQAVPFWLVERVHSQHSETGAKPSSDRDDWMGAKIKTQKNP